MKNKNTINTQIENHAGVPRIIYGSEDIKQNVSVDPLELSNTMRELGISDKSIEYSTLYIDPKNRIQTFGTHYPNTLGRLRFWFNEELQELKADIVRLSTSVRGKARTSEQLNRTLVHELEHVAQTERKDAKVTVGHIAIWGLATAGAVIGSRLGKNGVSKFVGASLGAVVGHSIGYLIAPHEVQARKRAGQNKYKKAEVTTNSVTTHNRDN